MSIPHSKVLSVTKGFGAVAQLHNNSPSQSQIVNVNIKNNLDQSNERNVEIKDPQPVVYPPSDNNVNPYSSLADQEQQELSSII